VLAVQGYFLSGLFYRKDLSTAWAFHTGAVISKHVPSSNAEVINFKKNLGFIPC